MPDNERRNINVSVENELHGKRERLMYMEVIDYVRQYSDHEISLSTLIDQLRETSRTYPY